MRPLEPTPITSALTGCGSNPGIYKEVLRCACAPSHRKKTRIKKLIWQLKTQEAHIRKAHKGGEKTERRAELDSWFGRAESSADGEQEIWI